MDKTTEPSLAGAKFYYLRRVLHDWDDAHCVQILERLTEAMATDSYVLIDKVAIPDMNIHWRTAFEDLHMAVIGGKKRTRAEWETLATQA
jgi:demethylsterigmatocystin 6-O-methyltransferase